MCDIIHQRHYKFYYRFDTLFNMSNLRNTQTRLLSIIHGLTKRVIKEKKEVYEKTYSDGQLPSPSLNEIIAQSDDETVDKKKAQLTSETMKLGQPLRDDLDENDENDIGEKRRLAFLDLMVEAKYSGANINDHDIKEEVDTIMFEVCIKKNLLLFACVDLRFHFESKKNI